MLDASTPHEVLASALAAAFPSWEDRAEVAREAGLGDVQLTGDPVSVWKDLVDEGAQRGRLDALLRAADARRAGWRSARWMRLVPLAALVVVVIGTVVVFRALSGPSVEELAIDDVGTTREPVQALPDAEGEPAAAGPTTPEPPDAPAPEPSAAPGATITAPAAAPASMPPLASVPAMPAAAAPLAGARSTGTQVGTPEDPVTPGNCGGRQGWAYLGETTDVVASDAWTVTRSYNVRTDYPRRDNHYAMAPAICVLHPGDVVAIPDGPTKVDGGAFWIHIQGR